MRLSPLKLKLKITEIEIASSESAVLRSVILALFPSAHVSRPENPLDHPESRVSVQTLSVGLRVGAGGTPGAGGETGEPEAKGRAFASRRLLPHLVVVVKLKGVAIEVAKAYLAPEPPAELRSAATANGTALPAALPAGNRGKLPAFHQDSVLEIVEGEDVLEAERVTWLVERWSECVLVVYPADVDKAFRPIEP